MNKWSRLNTTIKLAFGMSDAGNLLEPVVNVFSPVANLTSQAVDAVGDYLPQAYVNEANAATKSLSEDTAASKINPVINAINDSDFYKNYSTATTDPKLTRRLKSYGLDLSTRANASPLRQALNSIRAERHFSKDDDAIWKGVLGNQGSGKHLDKDHINAIRRETALADNAGVNYDIGAHAKQDLFNIPFEGRHYLNTKSMVEPSNAQEYSESMLAPLKEKGRIPLTDTISDFEGINNPEFARMGRVSNDAMSNDDFKEYAWYLKTKYGPEEALKIINSQISGDGIPSLLDIELPKKR